MAQEPNTICDICGKKYHVCNSSSEVKTFTPWKIVTDTLSHYEIFLVLSEYTNTKNKGKAKKELSKCDLSDMNTFNEKIKRVINEIMEVSIDNDDNIKRKTNENKQQKRTRSKFSVKDDKVANNDIE